MIHGSFHCPSLRSCCFANQEGTPMPPPRYEFAHLSWRCMRWLGANMPQPFLLPGVELREVQMRRVAKTPLWRLRRSRRASRLSDLWRRPDDLFHRSLVSRIPDPSRAAHPGDLPPRRDRSHSFALSIRKSKIQNPKSKIDPPGELHQ